MKKKPTVGSSVRTAKTVKAPTGTVAPVTNPLDLWYLCEKINYALKNPSKRRDGQLMYQRRVTRLIRRDDRYFNYHFPYIGEVGYDMTHIGVPPTPLMSKKRPNWPTTFPLSQFRLIKQSQAERLLGHTGGRVERILELLTRDELEKLPLPKNRDIVFNDALDTILKRKGSFRIPDVIRIQNITLTGKPAFSQSNIHTVIEIKFPGDKLSPEQQMAYEDIAGDEDKFRLMETPVCKQSNKRKREWIRESMYEPVYKPVADVLGETEQVCLREDVPAYQLLEGEIEGEFQAVKHRFGMLAQEWANAQGVTVHTLKAPMDNETRIRLEREQKQAAAYLGSIQVAPMAAVPVIAGGSALLTAANSYFVSTLAGVSVRYTQLVTRFTLVGGASMGGMQMATADEKNTPQDSELPLMASPLFGPESQDFVYWPD